jgi:hypothetical protein
MCDAGRELQWGRRDEAAAKSRIPMLIPARNIPRIPHIPPRQNPGDGEPGNVGNAGKNIPVNDVVSSNVKRTTPGWSGRYERNPRL